MLGRAKSRPSAGNGSRERKKRRCWTSSHTKGSTIHYIAGPPAMVAAMRKMLASAGVDEDDIRTEEFSG